MKRLVLTIAILIGLAAPAWAGLHEADAAYERGEYATALREWRPLAEQGDTNAQSFLGFMYDSGIGVPQNHTEAVKWYRKAADGGSEGEAGTTVIEPAQTPNAAAKAAQKHEKREEESAGDWWFGGIPGAVALFTFLLVICTGWLTWIAHRQNQIMRTIERAYVTMSHDSKSGNPGLKIDPRAGTATVAIDVRNYGRTPAEVTDVFLDLAFDALPPPHSYVLPPEHQQTRAFLVTQSGVNYRRTFDGLDSNDLFAVMEDEGEERKLWLYGYVDYRDSFGTRYRGGYMRRYEPFDHTAAPDALGHFPERKNNLVFDPTPKFNYDQRRKGGEGNDWDEGE